MRRCTKPHKDCSNVRMGTAISTLGSIMHCLSPGMALQATEVEIKHQAHRAERKKQVFDLCIAVAQAMSS